jgi:hypothetical protein
MWLFKALRSLGKSRLVIAILGIVGSVAGVWYGKWSDRPRIGIDIVSIRRTAPDDVKVFLPIEDDFRVLGNSMEDWFWENRPSLAATLIGRPEPSGAIKKKMQDRSGEMQYWHTSHPLPIPFFWANISQLRQLYDLEDLPTEVLAGAIKNAAIDDAKPLKEQHQVDVAEELATHTKSMQKAKARLEQLEATWSEKYGIFRLEVLLTNFGGRPTSLRTPVKLHIVEGDQQGALELTSKDDAQSIILGAGESKGITLVSQRLDRDDRAVNRKFIQERWGHNARCRIVFTDLAGEANESKSVPFALLR